MDALEVPPFLETSISEQTVHLWARWCVMFEPQLNVHYCPPISDLIYVGYTSACKHNTVYDVYVIV